MDAAALLYPREFKTCDGRVLVIDCARPDDSEEITDFIQQHFIAKNPNLYLIPYIEDEAESFRPFLTGYMNLMISQSVSLTVRDPSAGGKLAAVRMNKIENRNDPKEEEESPEEGKPPKEVLLIFALLGALNEGINLFDQYKTDKILHLAMVAVSSDYGRLGLASELYKLSIEIGQNIGAGAIVTEAVSVYAAKAAASFGLQTLREVVYEEFQLEDGSKPYAPVIKELGDHRTGKLMARSLKME